LNGSFENPSIIGFAQQPTNTDWTFTGTSGIVENGSVYGNLNAPEGTQAAYIQESAEISQEIYITNTDTYNITFQTAQRNTQSQTLEIFVDGTSIGIITPTSSNYETYISSSVSLQGGQNHNITLKGTNPLGGDNTAFVDDIEITVVLPEFVNPGFETPVISTTPGYVYNPTNGGWTFNSSGIIANSGGFGNPNAPEGVQSCFLQQSGYIEQTLYIPGAGTYTLSMLAAQRPNNTQTFNVYYDGNLIGTITPSSTSYLAYSTNNFTVTPGNHTIKLEGTNPLGGDNTAFVDDIEITVAANSQKKGKTKEINDLEGTSLNGLQLTSFPNPFKEYTNIRFNLEHASMVHLKIYTLTGKELISQSKKHSLGMNEIKIQKNNLSTGIYLLRVTTDSETKTIKLVVK
jgi:hypothetical protein